MLDKLENQLRYVRAREIVIGSADKKYKKALHLLDKAMTSRECKEALDFGLKHISSVEIDTEKSVLNIDTTGEIFVVIDHFSNMELEKELGKLGVHVHRRINLTDWMDRSIWPSILRFSETHGEKANRYAREFLKRDIGGDAVESVGDAILAGKESSTDGLIHILPFTCMPEIISQNILPKISNEKDIPVMSLVMDEFAGKVGFVTRIEAFVDLARRRKMQKMHVFS